MKVKKYLLRRKYTIKWNLSLGRFLIIISFFIFHSSLVNGEIRYVSKTGASIPPYTSWATAADSIQKCINICQPGDTVYVGNGEYRETVVMIPRLALIGSDWDSTIINTIGLLQPGYPSVWFKDSCYLRGFKIIVSDETLVGDGVYAWSVNDDFIGIIEQNSIYFGAAGIFAGNCNLEITNNRINFSNHGIRLFDINRSTICNNQVFDPISLGIYSEIGARPYIFNNIIKLNSEIVDGIDCTFSYSNNIKNNLIIGNDGEDGIITFNKDTLFNNIIYGRLFSSGIYTYGRDYSKNNSITAGSRGYVVNSFATDTPFFKYNNVWGNNQNYVNFVPDSTNISVDPMFVNPDSMNFYLQMFSPLINAGDPSILDIDGSRSDIGLYGGPFGESYSYKDYPPKPPKGLSGWADTLNVTLKWKRNTESDFNSYRLYRDTVMGFTADSTTMIAELTDTTFSHIIPAGITRLYYKLKGVDNQGNVSQVSEEVGIILVSVEGSEYQIVQEYELYQSYPNPFNPSTIISYRLKERSYVKLRVYNISGELVAVLVNEMKEAGYHEAEFYGNKTIKSESIVEKIASGIYLYKLDVINENNIPVYSSVKKMIYLK